jgi:hypothetical protein
MKTVRFMFILSMLAFPAGVIAQCSGTIQHLTYDTTVTGNGDAVHVFSFPKFNIPTGTLMEVRLESEATIGYGFTAENTSTTQGYPTYSVRVSRNDEIYSDALPGPSNSLSLIFPTARYPNALAISDGIPGSGPDFHEEPYGYALNHVVRQQTLTNTASYLGIGNVAFEYTINSSTIVPLGTNITVPVNASSADTLTYSITYVYCQSLILASENLNFTARKKDESTADISWINSNESNTKKYILEKSTNGIDFRYVAEFDALSTDNHVGKYFFQYVSLAEENGKITFRLKEIEKNDAIKYSPLRMVEFTKKGGQGILVYPNPGNGLVAISFNDQKRGDWQVDVIGINGQILGRHNFKNTSVANLDLRKKLSKGTYLLRSIDQRSMRQYVQKIVIQ